MEAVKHKLTSAEREEATARAHETSRCTKLVSKIDLADSGIVQVLYGPSPFPVFTDDEAKAMLPVSVTPIVFQVLWQSVPGATQIPPMVDIDLVLLRGKQGGVLIQLWVMEKPSDVERVLSEAFGLHSKIVFPKTAPTN